MAVFINYRRDDTEGDVRAIYNRLAEMTDPASLFLDFEAIGAGEDWEARIKETLDKVQAALVVIGPNWLELLRARDQSGRPDLVRREIAASLGNKKVRVKPLTVKGASLPAASDLPDDIKGLVGRNAVEIRGSSWESDTNRLVEILQEIGAMPHSRRTRWLQLGKVGGVAAVVLAATAFYLDAPHKLSCAVYAQGAVAQYQRMTGKPECNRVGEARWQDNFGAHYGWCLVTPETYVVSERYARERWLTDCGAK